MEPRKRPGAPTRKPKPGAAARKPKPGKPVHYRRGATPARGTAGTAGTARLGGAGRLGAGAARLVAGAARAGAAGRSLPGLLAIYLAATFVLLTVVFLVAPPRSGSQPPGGATWDYQRETVALQGRGVLNAYARGAVGATAALARASIERQRDVHRLNLLGYLAGEPAAAAVGRWRHAHGLALEGATIALLVGLAGYGLLRRPNGRAWLVAVLGLLAVTVLLTRPLSASRVAGEAGVAVPNAVLRVAVQGDPGPRLHGGSQQVQQALAGRYWNAFVAEPLSRLQTGSTVLATAPPAGKPGVLGYLRGKVSAVNDWAIGRHGVERAVISTFAVVYVLPFALALCALAMLATCAQALLLLLVLAGPLAAAAAVEPRWRRAVLRYWLAPALAVVGLLAAAALGSFLVVRGAEALRAADSYLGLLLAGSAWPALAIWLLARRWAARHGSRRTVVVRGGVA